MRNSQGTIKKCSKAHSETGFSPPPLIQPARARLSQCVRKRKPAASQAAKERNGMNTRKLLFLLFLHLTLFIFN